MALATELEVVNSALIELGSTVLANLTGTDKKTVAINAKLPLSRQAVLSMFHWGFATKRVKLTSSNLTGLTAIAGITKADPGVVTTSLAHGRSDGDRVLILDVLGMTEVNGQVFTVANKNATDLFFQIERFRLPSGRVRTEERYRLIRFLCILIGGR